MFYAGQVDRRKVDINKMLLQKLTLDKVKQKADQLKSEVRQEVKKERGMNEKQIAEQSLDEFAKCDELADLIDGVSTMLSRQEERK